MAWIQDHDLVGSVELSSTITSILQDPDIKIAIYAFAALPYASFQAGNYAYTRDAHALCSAIANKMVSLILQNVALRQKIEEILVEQELEGAIPFVGWALRILGISATLATIGQTLGEVLSSPAIFTNTAS